MSTDMMPDSFGDYMIEHGVIRDTYPDRPEIWIQTLGSGYVDLTAPTPAQINLRDMAFVLARTPRFGGHTKQGIYSVLQHELEGAKAILRDTGRRDWAAAFLLHDGHEYVMGDKTTPVAQALAEHAVLVTGDLNASRIVSDAIRSLKTVLDAAIYAKACVPWPLDSQTHNIVKLYDLRMCRTERDARLAPPPFAWHESIEECVPVEGCDLYPWSAEVAFALYMNLARGLLPAFCYSVDSPQI